MLFLPACLSTCPPACPATGLWPASLLPNLPASLPTCLLALPAAYLPFAHFRAFPPVCRHGHPRFLGQPALLSMHAALPASWPSGIPIDLAAGPCACPCACLPVCLPIFLPACWPTGTHLCIPVGWPTCLHTTLWACLGTHVCFPTPPSLLVVYVLM